MTILTPPLLEEMLDTATAVAAEPPVPLHSDIGRDHAEVLQAQVAAIGAGRAVEVGMAFGLASLAILGAGSGVELTSIDPFQTRDYDCAGVKAVAHAGLREHHDLIELPSSAALPQLVAARERYSFAYIDGWHTFDAAFVDFFYIDQLLEVGGVVAFNDCAMMAVHRVCGFVLSHRDYEELDVGFEPSYVGPSRLETVKRRRQGRQHQDRYFVKRSDSLPAWDFYADF